MQYLAAIGAGWLAQLAASSMPLTQVADSDALWYGGSTLPFDLSLAFLLTAMPAIYFMWQARRNATSFASFLFFLLKNIMYMVLFAEALEAIS